MGKNSPWRNSVRLPRRAREMKQNFTIVTDDGVIEGVIESWSFLISVRPDGVWFTYDGRRYLHTGRDAT